MASYAVRLRTKTTETAEGGFEAVLYRTIEAIEAAGRLEAARKAVEVCIAHDGLSPHAGREWLVLGVHRWAKTCPGCGRELGAHDEGYCSMACTAACRRLGPSVVTSLSRQGLEPDSTRRERIERGLDEACDGLRGCRVEALLERLTEANLESEDGREARRARALVELLEAAETVGHLTRELELIAAHPEHHGRRPS